MRNGDDPGNIDTGRVLALSDGVFAIAGTLLVLDLRIPNNLAYAQTAHRARQSRAGIPGVRDLGADRPVLVAAPRDSAG